MNKNNNLLHGKKTVEVKAENVVGTHEEVLNKLSLILGKPVKVQLVTEDYFVVRGGRSEVYVYLLPDFIYVGKYEVFRKTQKRRYYTVKDNVGYSLIDSNANWIIKKRYYSIDPIGENYFKVVERSIVNGIYLYKVGCVDLKGIEVISANYTDIRHLIKDLFLCTTNIDAVSIQSILRAGNIRAIPFPIEEVQPINSTSLAIKVRNKWGFYNAEIKALTGFDYDGIEFHFDEQRKTVIATKNRLMDLVRVDETGVYVLWENAKSMTSNSIGKLTFIRDGEKSIIIRDDGDIIHEVTGNEGFSGVVCDDRTSNIILSKRSSEGYTGFRYDGTSVQLNGRYICLFTCDTNNYYYGITDRYRVHTHLYDENLNLVWDDYKCWTTGKQGYISVEKDNKVGLYNLNNRTLVVPMNYEVCKDHNEDSDGFKCQYEDIEGFKHLVGISNSGKDNITYWSVVQNGKKGVVKTTNNGYETVLECKYDNCVLVRDTINNVNIFFILTLKGKTYLCDFRGNKISAGFDAITQHYGTNYFIVERNKLNGVINSKGRLITNVSYSRILSIDENKKEVRARTTKGKEVKHWFITGNYKDPDEFKS